MTTWLPAVLIGAVLGYGVIYLREVGLSLAVIVTLGLMVVYARQGRLRDIGLLMVAEGIWPSYVAGWGLWQEATRVDTEVGSETWLFLAGGLLLILGGLAIVGSGMGSANRPSRD
jgi:hypothetical protein